MSYLEVEANEVEDEASELERLSIMPPKAAVMSMSDLSSMLEDMVVEANEVERLSMMPLSVMSMSDLSSWLVCAGEARANEL
jgi:hypothetical protein